jgi:hypothetical protein
MLSTPDLYTLVSAAAEGEKELTAFDQALLKAATKIIPRLIMSKKKDMSPPSASLLKQN